MGNIIAKIPEKKYGYGKFEQHEGRTKRKGGGKMEGYDKTQDGLRIDNIPRTGVLTGKYDIDSCGCWWEYIRDCDEEKIWVIGDYP